MTSSARFSHPAIPLRHASAVLVCIHRTSAKTKSCPQAGYCIANSGNFRLTDACVILCPQTRSHSHSVTGASVGAAVYSLGPCDFLRQVCIRTAIFSADPTSCTQLQVHPCGRAGLRVAPCGYYPPLWIITPAHNKAGLSSFNMGS